MTGARVRGTLVVGAAVAAVLVTGCSSGSGAQRSDLGRAGAAGERSAAASTGAGSTGAGSTGAASNTPQRPAGSRPASGPDRQPGTGAGRTAAPNRSSAVDPSTRPSLAPPPPRNPAAPDFAACRYLDRAAAAGLLGGEVGAGVADRRLDVQGRTLVDGCVYTGPGGSQVAYLAWWAPQRPPLTEGLATGIQGATRFSPQAGDAAAGLELPGAAGMPGVVQVNAARRELLVQVTAIGPDRAAARTAAVAAARDVVAHR